MICSSKSERQIKYLGDLPEGWAVVPFGRIVSLSQYGLNCLASESGQYAMLRMNNLQDGVIDLNDLVYVDLDDEEATKYLLGNGDLLLNRTNSADLVGKTALFEFDKPFVFASYLIRIKIDKTKADPRFVNYFLNSEKGEQRLKAFSTKGASQVNLNPTTLKNHYYFPLPPLPEQRKIAEILSTWDRAIELTEQLIAAKERRQKALMQRLLTGKVRFAGFTEPWEEVQLGDIAAVIMGQSPSSANYNEDGNGMYLIQGNADIMNNRTAPRVWTTQVTKICRPGDIILSVRAPIGEVAWAEHEACIGRGVSAIRADNFNQQLLYYLLVHSEPKWLRLGQGSTFTAINSSDIREFHLRVPGEPVERERIANCIQQSDVEIGLLRDQLTSLDEQKKGLMQQLLTGKRRVKVEEEE